MIDKNQIITMKWSPTNRDYLEKLGYIYEWRKEVSIPLYQLWEDSHAKISITCDYCNKSFARKYIDHIKIYKNEVIHKDACGSCKHLKQNESTQYKLAHNLISKGDMNYWSSKENRLNELEAYIKKYGSLENLYSSNEEGYNLWLIFKRHNHSIPEALKELNLSKNGLNYKEQSVFTYKYYPKKYFNNFNNLKYIIQNFIDLYGKFPTINELKYECKIGDKIIKKYGGINNIRKMMDYRNHYELIDDNGYKNRSSYEYFTAQFLIHNNVSYLRDQHPFPQTENKYESDFMFEVDGKIYHCEVWGNMDDSLRDYNKTKKDKIKLYNKYKINLISVESFIFQSSIEDIQKSLSIIFEPILNKTLYIVPQTHLITNALSDNDILNKMMLFSKDKSYLPYVRDLKENNLYCLYEEVIKRYGTYNNFAETFGLNIRRKEIGYWNIQKLLDECKEILNKGIPIDQKELRKYGYPSISGRILKLGYSAIEFRLKLLSLYSGILPEKEIAFLNNVINNCGTNIKNRVTPSQQQQAQQILDNYYKQCASL